MSRFQRMIVIPLLVAGCLTLAGCASVGVGMSVGIPVGDHGYISVGGGRGGWY
jgi:hypothetical protein